MRFEFKGSFFEMTVGHPKIMGILNVTPDSFSDGGCFVQLEDAVQHAQQMEAEGADLIDVGGESTRPGANPVPAELEMERVIPVIQALKKTIKIPISIDTTKSIVAKTALIEGADIVNDVSGLTADPQMVFMIANSRAGVVVMHRRGTAQNMQSRCSYRDVIKEVKKELSQRVELAFKAGIEKKRIILDPGIGFSKTVDQNHEILKDLGSFLNAKAPSNLEDLPWLVGVSRKSFLGGKVEERDTPTLAFEVWSALQGCHMIRTHNVKALRDALHELTDIRKEKS